MSVTISIKEDSATPRLRALQSLSGAGRAKLNEFIGGRCQFAIRSHLLAKKRNPAGLASKIGAPVSGYYQQAAEKTQLAGTDENKASITVNQPGIARAGGDITVIAGTQTPGVKYLTIPLDPEAYNNRIRQGTNFRFTGGFFIHSKNGNLLYCVKNPDGTLRPLYLLKPRVLIKQDRTILPSDAEILEAAASGVNDFMEFIAENSN